MTSDTEFSPELFEEYTTGLDELLRAQRKDLSVVSFDAKELLRNGVWTIRAVWALKFKQFPDQVVYMRSEFSGPVEVLRHAIENEIIGTKNFKEKFMREDTDEQE